jgi:hypothetical protein
MATANRVAQIVTGLTLIFSLELVIGRGGLNQSNAGNNPTFVTRTAHLKLSRRNAFAYELIAEQIGAVQRASIGVPFVFFGVSFEGDLSI